MKQAIIFDLEGTLVTLNRQYYIVDLVLKENGVYLDIPKIYKVRGFNKYSVSGVFFKVLIAIHKFNLDPEMFLKENTQEIIDEHLQKLGPEDLVLAERIRKKYKDLRYGDIGVKDELYPNIAETLESLSKNYLLGVYTARKQQSTISVLKNLGIDKFFSFVLGEETKRSPEAPLKIQEKLNTLDISIAESWLVGDAEFDIIHGRNAGLKTVMVLTGNASIALQKQAKPDYTIETIEELPKILTI